MSKKLTSLCVVLKSGNANSGSWKNKKPRFAWTSKKSLEGEFHFVSDIKAAISDKIGGHTNTVDFGYIEQPDGTKVHVIEKYVENEVILPPDSKFKLIKKGSDTLDNEDPYELEYLGNDRIK